MKLLYHYLQQWGPATTGFSVIYFLFVSLLCEHCIITGLYALHASQNSQLDGPIIEGNLQSSRSKRSILSELQNKSMVSREHTIQQNATKIFHINATVEEAVLEKLKNRITAHDKLMQKLRYVPTSGSEFLKMYEHYCKLREVTPKNHHLEGLCPCIPTQLGR